MKIKLIYIVPVLLGVFAACKKSNMDPYSETPMAYFYRAADTPTPDSIVYSFAIKPDSVMSDTIRIPMRIMGLSTDKERTINVMVLADSTTAQASVDYEIQPVLVAANTYATTARVVVYRSVNVEKKEQRLRLIVGASADFQPGVKNSYQTTRIAGGTTSFLLKINNILTKPANWDKMLVYYFGTYSEVKYRFVIQATGVAEFPDTLPYGIYPVYQSMCKQALEAYEQEHGPLIDEKGKVVSF